MMLLTLKMKGGKLAGTLTQPRHFTEDWTGDFVGVTLPIVMFPVVGKWDRNHVEFTLGSKPDRDKMSVRLNADGDLLVAGFRGIVPDWRFERISVEEGTRVDTSWPAYVSDPEIVLIRHQLRSMAEADKKARERQIIDQSQVDKISDESRPLLEQIYSVYGWPKISIFGAQSSDDYWLLAQHQPLAFQEQMMPAMKTAVDAGEATKETTRICSIGYRSNVGNRNTGALSRIVKIKRLFYMPSMTSHILNTIVHKLG